MGFLAKVGHLLTILMMGYETHNVLDNKSEHGHEIIIKTDEIFAKKVDKNVDPQIDNYEFHKIYLVIITIIILLVIAIKLYKRLVKDLSSAVITA